VTQYLRDYYRLNCLCGPIEVERGKAGLKIHCPTCERDLDVPNLSTLQKLTKITRTEGRPAQVHLRLLLAAMVPCAVAFTATRYLGIETVLLPLAAILGCFVMAAIIGGWLHRVRKGRSDAP